ncbi:MAG: PEP-utilizing enzyme, partial [Nannocystaceae bacterium]
PSAERLRGVAARDDVIAAARASRPSRLAVARVIGPTLARMLARALGRPRRVRDAYLRGLTEGLAAARARIRGAAPPSARLQAALAEVDDAFRWVMAEGALPLIPLMIASGALVAALTRRYAPGVAEDALLRGLDGNITTEMNLALGDLVDLARPHPELRAAIFGDGDLLALRGRPALADFFAGLDRFLAAHGSRCAGEIDVGVPRWRDDPRALAPMMAGLLGGEPGVHRARHHAAQVEAEAARAALIAGARRRPIIGWLLGPVVSAMSDRTRVFAAIREHHKAAMIELLAEIRAAVLAVGGALERAGSLARADDVFLLDLDEVRAAALAVESGSPPRDLIGRCDARRQEEARYAALTPPPLMTDEGEIPPLPAGIAAPPGTLLGTPASSGAAIGRARVIRDPGREVLAAGEILVAPFTDPGWTPLFMHAAGLVMEVGGVMTHGSVIARELGIPAVVAVDGALARIRDGQRIRVDGDRGWVELLGDDNSDDDDADGAARAEGHSG